MCPTFTQHAWKNIELMSDNIITRVKHGVGREMVGEGSSQAVKTLDSQPHEIRGFEACTYA